MILARRNLLEVGGASRMNERIMPSQWSQLLYIEVFCATVVYVHEFERVLNCKHIHTQQWLLWRSLSPASVYIHLQHRKRTEQTIRPGRYAQESLRKIIYYLFTPVP
jgi:hypothetical protein